MTRTELIKLLRKEVDSQKDEELASVLRFCTLLLELHDNKDGYFFFKAIQKPLMPMMAGMALVTMDIIGGKDE